MKKIVGYAIVWNSPSVNFAGYIERINKSALDGVLEKPGTDVLALLDHDPSRGVLARYTAGQGTLKLSVDNHGLKYAFTPPQSAAAVVESVERGDLRGCSFAFALTQGGDVWKKTAENEYTRTIIQFSDLSDITLAYHPCYPETEVHTE
jgi:HK97 family phage prohead protease